MTDAGTKLGACLAGFGVAQVIDLGLEQHLASGALINLFPDWSDELFPLNVYYISRHHVPAKVRAFIDFILGSLKAEAEPGAPHCARAAATLEAADAG